MQVALVCMPWASAQRGSIALGILKRSLRRTGIPSETHYLNLRLAARMHQGIYETLSNMALVGDWLFSRHLFGSDGSGELANGREDVIRAEGPELLACLERYSIDSETIVQDILPAFLDDCLETIAWDRYAVVGFTSVFVQHTACLLLARRIKARWPHIRIVLGGSNVAGPMGRETLRSFDWVDYIVDGEGEAVFPELVRRIAAGRSGADLPGISCRESGNLHIADSIAPRLPLRQVPIPDYADYFAALRHNRLEERVSARILYEGARGCWWGQKTPCTFCSQNGQSLSFRPKTARRVHRELNLLARRHECLNFEAVDNVLDPRQLRELFPALARGGRDFKLFYDVRSSMTRRQVALLRSAGVRAMEVGIESLHDGVLRLMHKGVSTIQNIQMLKWCAEEGISVTWHLLFGLPGELPAHYTETLAAARKITHLQPPLMTGRIFLQRFSPYFQEPERWGIRKVSPKRLYRFIYPPGKCRLDELAFHFDWEWEGQLTDLDKLAAPLRELVDRWRETFLRQQIFFDCRRGPGFVELLDNRPLGPEWRIPSPRRTLLKGLAAAVYEACEEAKPLGKIVAAVASSGVRQDTLEEVSRTLSQLVHSGLVMESGGRFFGLALPWGRRP
jgi:ribosomal peptide maturation radical SAM protein 1